MKALFLTPSLSRNLGGIFEIECALARELDRLGVEIEAAGLIDDGWPRDAAAWLPIRPVAHLSTGPKAFGYSVGLANQVRQSTADILHLHALWMYPSLLASRWGKQRPYLVTPNGMLEPWALANSAWKKKAAGLLYERRMLQGAACLQANTEKELRDFRAYGLKNPVAIIPNGVDLPEMRENEPLKPERKILLFLGRLHPKKGLVNALKAWAAAGGRRSEVGGQISEIGGQRSEVRSQRSEVGVQGEWQFVIAGWDQGGHEAELKALATDLGIPWADLRDHERADALSASPPAMPDKASPIASVASAAPSAPLSAFRFPLSAFPLLFTGPAFGEQKDQLLRAASAFILPSFSEGLPMSVLEAWAYGLPVLMTDHCNLPEGFANNAALRIGTDVESIAAGLRTLLAAPTSAPHASDLPPSQSPQSPGRPLTSDLRLPISDLQSLGRNGRALVERQFTWPQVARQTQEVYDWVLGQGPKPDFVSV